MKKGWVFTLLLCCLVGCRAKKEIHNSSIEKTLENMTVITKEKVISDAPVLVRPSLQLSQSRGIDSSRLETDYAVSTAWWDGGRLHHKIWNKPEFIVNVPGGKTEEKEMRKDSIASRESAQEYKYIEKEKYRFLNAFFYWMGILGVIVVILFMVFKKYLKIQIKR